MITQLDEFIMAYIEVAVWSSNDSWGEPLDANYSIEDIDPDTLAEMIEDCRRFQEENATDLIRYDHPQWTAAELGGHDFWLTRNGHGAGFWDRDCLPEEAGERLTDAAKQCGGYYLYVSDGTIYGERG